MSCWVKVNFKMPEDILKVHNMDGYRFTPEVLIPHDWGNQYGGGTFIPAYRYCYKGQKSWHWSVKGAKPLVWMPIPRMPPTNELLDAAKEVYGLEPLKGVPYEIQQKLDNK